jgi:hypothetical protein
VREIALRRPAYLKTRDYISKKAKYWKSRIGYVAVVTHPKTAVTKDVSIDTNEGHPGGLLDLHDRKMSYSVRSLGN